MSKTIHGYAAFIWMSFWALGSWATLFGSPPGSDDRADQPRGPSDSQPVQSADTSTWKIQRAELAVERMRAIIGLKELRASQSHAELTVLKEDTTPYLSEQIINRSLWHVEVRDFSLRREATPDYPKDRYLRTFDVLVDPVTGCVVKAVSRWPHEVRPMAPTVDSRTAAMQMQSSGREKYHSFSRNAPKISLFEAIAVVERAGWVPTRAKQIIGEYVVWSRMDREPRSVWAVTLRGVPVLKPPPGTPKDYQDQYRHIVDSETGEWLYTTNLPRLDLSDWQGE